MSSSDRLRELLLQVRRRDERAARELVAEFEPQIRLAIRVRLVDPRLRRFADSADLCQSVLASFFVRLMHGQFELESVDDIRGLLVKMAHRKIASLARRHTAGKRDMRRECSLEEVAAPAAPKASPATDPLADPSFTRLADRVREQLTPAERALADARLSGASWSQIAESISVTPDAARRRLSRALDRVCRDLDLAAAGDDE